MPEETNSESTEDQHPDASREDASSADFPVVGIGASAGGLDALKRFFQNTPAGSGAAYIVVQHLDPTHESMLPELLNKITDLKVEQAEDRQEVKPDHVYIIPPNKSMALKEGRLQLSPPRERRGLRLPIDAFFRSLAWDKQERAIAVVLSGTGSDGTQGVKAVKEFGGLTLVQEPEDAQQPGMPLSAIDTGLVDIVLPVEQIPERLTNFIRYRYALLAVPSRLPDEEKEQGLGRVVSIIKRRQQHDFSSYKLGTLTRRVERRMGLNNIDALQDYCEKLETDEEELNELTRDLLISVTSFFRDPDAYQALAKKVIQKICEELSEDEEIRCWVPGCATGEEAYSLAILVFEALEKHKKDKCQLRIFATDIDRDALEYARAGRYPESIAADISPERVERFFTKTDGEYQVKKFVRESITFSIQNVLSDPPFSRLDLISCRNLMIYLNSEAQRNLLSVFHFALQPEGFLFLGSAEGAHDSDLFKTVDSHWRLYQRTAFPADRRRSLRLHRTLPQAHTTARPQQEEISFRQIAVQAILDHHAPASVLVNGRYEILQVLGRANDYLRIPEGDPTNSILDMAPAQTRNKLRASIHQCKQSSDAEHRSTLYITSEIPSEEEPIELIVRHIDQPNMDDDLYLIVFQKKPGSPLGSFSVDDAAKDAQELIHHLEDELKSTREDLESTIEQLETANEELKASNEEMMSMNEEFQSTNEELETSKEELQSLNEELTTVNAQLQEKMREVEQNNNDINNLLNSTNIATVFLDTQLRIRRFTPAAGDLLRILNADVGRPLDNIRTSLEDPGVSDDARQVLNTLTPRQKEIEDGDDDAFLRRISPYRTEDNKIEGVVITYVDISERKKVEHALAQSEARHRTIGETVPFGSWTCDSDGRCTYVTRPFLDMLGKSFEEVVNFGWLSQVPEAERRQLLEDWMHCVETGCNWDYEYRIQGGDGKLYDVLTKGRPIRGEDGKVQFWAGFHLDITERKRMERELRELNENLEERVRERSREAVDRANQLRRLAGQLSRVEQRERHRLADVLHNHLQQILVAVKWRLDKFDPEDDISTAAKHHEELQHLIDQAIEQTRSLSHELSPLVLKHGGFDQGLEWLVGSMKEKHGLDVTVDAPEDLQEVSEETSHFLFEAIRELLFNSVKHSGDTKAWIRIESGEDDFIRLVVGDDGKGCEPELLSKTFSEDHKSYGLMSIRERLRLMGGSLALDSAPGKGFCATIEAPTSLDGEVQIVDPATAATPAPTVPSVRFAAPNDANGVSVLVVDDHEIVREGLIALLEESPTIAVVGEAGDGQEALEKARELAPDVVLMDVNMPKMNGIDATRAIREENPDIQIIGLSINDDATTERRMREAGAADYVSKNKQVNELCSLIAAAAGKTAKGDGA